MRVSELGFPRESFKFFVVAFLSCKAKRTLKGKDSLGNLNFMLFQDIFGGSLLLLLSKNSLPQRENNPQSANPTVSHKRVFTLIC